MQQAQNSREKQCAVVFNDKVSALSESCSYLLRNFLRLLGLRSSNNRRRGFAQSSTNLLTSSLLLTLVLTLFSMPTPLEGQRKSKSSRRSSSFFTLLSQKEVAEGVQYKHLRVSGGHSVHVLEVDMTSPEIHVFPVKGLENFTGLEKLTDMVMRRDSIEPLYMLGGINANFWSAYLNKPIGPTVIDGEVVQMHPYKQWSSLWITEGGEYCIDRVTLEGSVIMSDGTSFEISSVNYRTDSTGIVLYNQFSGSQVPYLEPKDSKTILKELENNSVPKGIDSTEAELVSEELRLALEEEARRSKIEFAMPGIVLKRIDLPRVNRPCLYRVEHIKTEPGSVTLGSDRVLLSLGADFPDRLPAIGDYCTITFSTNTFAEKPFLHAISGTPRLVREGKAKHEANIEGSTAKRFLHQRLPRSAVGINKEKTILYLVSVDGANPKKGTKGMTLAQLATAMSRIGAYDAINLDGGGSTSMVVEGANVVRMGGNEFARKISVGMVVGKCCKHKEYRQDD